MSTQKFASRFQLLTSHPPFGWQERLYARLLNGDVPPLCDIPTGMGKTSVLAVWLLALADQAAATGGAVQLPRRLVYIVDRRAVVDQATDDAQALLGKLQKPEDPSLQAVAAALRGLAAVSVGDKPFALSTLRGQYADNRDWSHDPARPAIIVGTVDMVGSRLLFSGYGGLGPSGRSQHAGLLGQDALIILDEAQLAPAFAETLAALGHAVGIGSGGLKFPFYCMSLTATPPRTVAPASPAQPESFPSAAQAARPPLTLVEADFERPLVRCRVRAAKALRFVLPEAGGSGKADDAFAQRMAGEAIRLAGANGAVVVFVDTVTTLEKINAALVKLLPGLDRVKQVLQFTGQMRGYERDRAFASDAKESEGGVFREFQRSRPRKKEPHKDGPPRTYPVFLLATSAGEVGVNFDADHAVCDLVSLERMAQRLGRVNRGGDQDGPAQVSVFLEVPPEKLVDVRKVTHRLLEGLPEYAGPQSEALAGTLSASPKDLGDILKDPDASQAYTPNGGPPPLDPARLDDWSLTSLRQDDFPRPQVAYWLRGISPDDDQAVTQIVWREELRYARSGEDASDLLETCPPLPREILQVPTYRAVPWLLARLRKHCGTLQAGEEPYPGEWAVIRTPAGRWEPGKLEALQTADKDKLKADLIGAMIVLPTTLGGLSGGFLNESIEDRALDVLEKSSGKADPSAKAYQRVLLQESTDGTWQSFEPPVSALTPTKIKGPDSRSNVIRHTAMELHQRHPDQSYRHLAREVEPEQSELEDSGEESKASDYWVEYFISTRLEPDAAEEEASLRGQTVPLQRHLDEAEEYARLITKQLALPASIKEAVVYAAKWHDLGKDRDHWQRAVGNPNPADPWAKSNRFYFDRRYTQGYRHEFGSLMDALYKKDEELRAHPERDLVLHLIAAHHGHGRPGFEEKAFDVPSYLHRQCAEAAAEAELRFDKLQRRFGWWGMAYLEALVKCADILASGAAEVPEAKKIPAPESSELILLP